MSKPIEVIVITPQDVFNAYLVWLAVILLAVAFAVWVMWPQRDTRRDPQVGVDADPVESAATQELPRPRGHAPRTGTIHAPQYQRHGVDDDTVVIVQAGERR